MIFKTQYLMCENNLKIEELGYVHVSNQTPSKDEMLTATFTVYSVDGDIIDSYIHPEGVAKFLTEDLLVVGQFLVVYENNVVYQGITFPKAGIYAAPGYAPPEAAGVVSISFPSASSETITQPLGLKFVKKNNDFQGAGVSLELQAQAKQHANTDDSDWSEWVTLATN